MKTADAHQNFEEHLTSFNKPRFTPFSKRPSVVMNFTHNPLHNYVIESSVCRQLIADNYNNICLDVLAQRMATLGRCAHIHQTMLMILPRLAAFDKQNFVKLHMPITMNYLLNTLRSREKERFHAFVTTGLIAVAIEEDIRPYIPKIMDVIRATLPSRETPIKKRINIDSSICKCITFLAHALQSQIRSEMQNIVDPMLATGLTAPLTICLRELAKNIPELKQNVSGGLLRMLSHILMNRPLKHPGMPKHMTSNVMSMSGGGDGDVALTVLALRTLGTFDFERQSLLQFVQHCADYYLIHEQQKIRLETVRTCSRYVNLFLGLINCRISHCSRSSLNIITLLFF